MKLNTKSQFLFFLALSLLSCNKYLDDSPNKSLVIAERVSDLQALLDNNDVMNSHSATSGEIASDEYFVTDDIYNALSKNTQKLAYIWEAGIYTGEYPNDWSYIYDAVNYSNIVLDAIDNINDNTATNFERNQAKGSALFFRAKSFLEAIQIWGNAYNSSNAKTDLGIPLPLHSDFNQAFVRSSVYDSYQQVISDLKQSLPLLPAMSTQVLRPSKVASFGLLARTFLLMADYDSAGKYADSALSLNSSLIDYNTLNANATYPVGQFNKEVVFQSINSSVPTILSKSRARIDSNLYKLYQVNDLRLKVFFVSNNDGTNGFKGGYNGTAALFNGIATDELYLISAECNARMGNINKAMEMLNILLKNRYLTNTYIPNNINNSQEAIDLILTERKKELLFRLLRWGDIKRLNNEGYNIGLHRFVNGTTYNLTPNDPKYALPLPDDIIQLSGMQQNPR